MNETPETIYLIPGEDVDGQMGYLWCDDPAPSTDHDPAEAVEYVRKDKHDEMRMKVAAFVMAVDTMEQATGKAHISGAATIHHILQIVEEYQTEQANKKLAEKIEQETWS